LDTVQFEADYTSEAIVALAEAAWIDGQALGIPGTPYLKVNSFFEPQATLDELTIYVEIIKLAEQQFSDCPTMTVDPDASYKAIVETEKGSFVIDLFVDKAPMAVNSFIFLAENGWFDGITFHRVLEGFVAQTGDPSGTGFGGPGYRYSVETSPDMLFDREGLVAMANAGEDSNGSQFFITYAEAPDLNGGYTIFGEVVEGMDVVRDISLRNPQGVSDLPPGDLLISITIEKD
jgi:cyclophilin family peptidyl-prolyl cis-trans isomerase